MHVVGSSGEKRVSSSFGDSATEIKLSFRGLELSGLNFNRCKNCDFFADHFRRHGNFLPSDKVAGADAEAVADMLTVPILQNSLWMLESKPFTLTVSPAWSIEINQSRGSEKMKSKFLRMLICLERASICLRLKWQSFCGLPNPSVCIYNKSGGHYVLTLEKPMQSFSITLETVKGSAYRMKSEIGPLNPETKSPENLRQARVSEFVRNALLQPSSDLQPVPSVVGSSRKNPGKWTKWKESFKKWMSKRSGGTGTRNREERSLYKS